MNHATKLFQPMVCELISWYTNKLADNHQLLLISYHQLPTMQMTTALFAQLMLEGASATKPMGRYTRLWLAITFTRAGSYAPILSCHQCRRSAVLGHFAEDQANKPLHINLQLYAHYLDVEAKHTSRCWGGNLRAFSMACLMCKFPSHHCMRCSVCIAQMNRWQCGKIILDVVCCPSCDPEIATGNVRDFIVAREAGILKKHGRVTPAMLAACWVGNCVWLYNRCGLLPFRWFEREIKSHALRDGWSSCRSTWSFLPQKVPPASLNHMKQKRARVRFHLCSALLLKQGKLQTGKKAHTMRNRSFSPITSHEIGCPTGAS